MEAKWNELTKGTKILIILFLLIVGIGLFIAITGFIFNSSSNNSQYNSSYNSSVDVGTSRPF